MAGLVPPADRSTRTSWTRTSAGEGPAIHVFWFVTVARRGCPAPGRAWRRIPVV